MADEKTQALSPTQKSAEDVKPSSARTKAEGESKARGSRREERNPIDRQEGPHPMTGKSMSYVVGAGRDTYSEGMYDTDRANDHGHFNR